MRLPVPAPWQLQPSDETGQGRNWQPYLSYPCLCVFVFGGESRDPLTALQRQIHRSSLGSVKSRDHVKIQNTAVQQQVVYSDCIWLPQIRTTKGCTSLSASQDNPEEGQDAGRADGIARRTE